MNIKVPPFIHARFTRECARLSALYGGRFSLNMLFVQFGNTLPPSEGEDPKQRPPARAAGADPVLRARSA